ncbi:MAG: hypothetical protein J6T72_02770 [Alphaproteobacteria bacterium]|nr:hypothetical protein [Alphaproteobacteria bacterium]
MKKNLLTLVLFFSLIVSYPARADFEAIQTVLTVIENVSKKIDNVYGKVIKVQEEIKKIRSGQIGPININNIVSKVSNAVATAKELASGGGGTLVKKFAAKVKKGAISQGLENKDKKAIEDGIVSETIPIYTDEAQTETFQAMEDANSRILREDLARLYAYAFTLRSNLAKEREENDDTPLETTDSREILALANKEALESARRFNRILDMQSSKSTIYLRLLLRTMSKNADDEKEE